MVYRVGIDIGSTTIKAVVMDGEERLIYQCYIRHQAKIRENLWQILEAIRQQTGANQIQIRITGSGAMQLSHLLHIEFTQEVVAVATALRYQAPQTDVAIELGGEDAKIIYFKGGLDERMNGVCAGGTGAFIDQMAALLQTDAKGLNELAKEYKEIYPIAARCGVFAKSDIQPLINEGARKEDIAASIFQAVVNQTISGLSCGKPIRGCVAFLGGPLHFLSELKAAFIRTLDLHGQEIIDLENSHLFAAKGAALQSGVDDQRSIDDLLMLVGHELEKNINIGRLEPLFNNEEEYAEFCLRHQQAIIQKADIKHHKGNCYLGIDAGSTTTKMAIINDDGELLFDYYTNNYGNPIQAIIDGVDKLLKIIPPDVQITRSCATGYGEELVKQAFDLDEGEVETVAHCSAAAFFNPNVDGILDIGGQDMKFIKLKDHHVVNVILNEACSSGCGSFIENFANSLGYDVQDFAQKALFAKSPIDLGSRCTVFMNSNVKQAQKEGAHVEDISAGLAYSVIKNALFKVIKLTDITKLGNDIVVQGGTFYNHAVLRSLEKIIDKEVICPDISGIMGAFGAALIARNNYQGQQTTTIPLTDFAKVEYTTSVHRCNGCTNHCVLTTNVFSNGKKHISGNRCEKVVRSSALRQKGENMFEFKRKRLFAYEPLSLEKAVRGQIGIPRTLNMYENYPFWATFFKELKFQVVLSPLSNREIYLKGMESVPSESECYPAKLAHGHVKWLIDQGIKTIFYPCIFYEHQEMKHAQNHYNCPMVIANSENVKNNIDEIPKENIEYLRPFVAFTNEQVISKRLVKFCQEKWNIDAKEVHAAVHKAWLEQAKAKKDIRDKGISLLASMNKHDEQGIVLVGRPYHIDPEINHGIPELISSYGLHVFTEDSLPYDYAHAMKLRALDQWTYHSRVFAAANFVSEQKKLELIQLNSFGCGLDAVTSDQVNDILSKAGKIYTLLKIDEISNLGAVKIRIRSLLAAMRQRQLTKLKKDDDLYHYQRVEFTAKMKKQGYTILAPQMSPLHFAILQPIFQHHGYHIVVLDNDNRQAIDTGLKYVNNDACFPSITVVGQIMDAVLSGKYDTDHLAIIMSQTGGCCRASNYVGFIRKALDSSGLSHIPVISFNANGLEKNSGFKMSPSLLLAAAKAVIYGDLLMRCLYRVRPYEKIKGSADALCKKWVDRCSAALIDHKSPLTHKQICQKIVTAFDTLAIDETLVKPKVGIVGEILVKYMPLANNHLVELLEKEGAEVVVPDLADFMNYCLYNNIYKHQYLGTSYKGELIAEVGIGVIKLIRQPAIEALKASKRFDIPLDIEKIAHGASAFLSLGNQYGEGWFLTGEMVELLENDVANVICIQPFGCLPNHVVGKGMIKPLKAKYPQANIIAVDYDSSASEVNQLNRIKLMLASAKA
ncbi:MAG: 2-hydroxyacyl-CoA dehydratase [Erysipelotrichaceae bacterium]|nr:2-hydroxyacyl-CoA dehydratase [Erysipelotrichaceae bacterium]